MCRRFLPFTLRCVFSETTPPPSPHPHIIPEEFLEIKSVIIPNSSPLYTFHAVLLAEAEQVLHINEV